MTKDFKPQLLTDKSRLQEIYDLRVTAYEHSPKSVYVNRMTFPNGWSDDLDELDNTIHWIIEDENKIIASARLAILENIEDTNEEFDKFELPVERPFAYFSRLVVHHKYRKIGLADSLDRVIIKFITDKIEIKFSICLATPNRHKALLELGFRTLGDIEFNWGGGQPKQTITKFLLQKKNKL